MKKTFSLFNGKSLFLFLGFYGLSMIGLSVLSFSRASYFKEHIENFPFQYHFTAIVLFLILFFSYLGLALLTRGLGGVKQKYLSYFFGFALLLGVLTPPFLSRDITGYLFSAYTARTHMQTTFSVPIIEGVPSDWKQDVGPIWWQSSPNGYGPLFQLLTLPFSLVPMPIISAVVLYKLFNVLIFLGCVWLFSKLMTQLSLPRVTIWLFALNPALIVHGVLEGHNDILMLFALLAAASLLLENKTKTSIIALATSVALKFVTIIFLPLYWFKEKNFLLKNMIVSLLLLSGLFILFSLPFGLPLEQMKTNLFSRNVLPCMYSCSPIPYILSFLPTQTGSLLRLALFIVCWLIAFFFTCYRTWQPLKFIFLSLAALLFIYTTWLTPWYLILLIPFGLLLSNQRLYLRLTLALTFYSLFHFWI